ncbi:hypothetical protein [Paenibacillus caui]|uniref:hypothetical protein n=1 Tax=Paenibacillus caui TaxID=2873927 RepID=UPI001CA92715|nr:hypothetical protein [Paenibacillus caui]
MKTKTIRVLIFSVLSLVSIILISYILYNNFKDNVSNTSILRPIAQEDITTVTAEKVTYTRNEKLLKINKIKLKLDQQEISELIRLYNSVPVNRIYNVNSISGSISFGVTLLLQDKSEIRIQYNSKDIFVTTTSNSNSKKYKIDQPEMIVFINKLLN